jgi:Na+-driven multidrug efflux pump
MYVLRENLLRLFSKESEQDRVIELGETLLICFAFNSIPSQVQTMTGAVYTGLGFIPQLALINIIGLAIVLVFLFPFYDEHGLQAFGWGCLVSSFLSDCALFAYLTGFKKRRELYELCAWTWDIAPFKSILSSLGWVGVRSVFVQLRYLVSVVLVTRMGLLYGAIYPVLQVRMAFATGASIAVAFFFLPVLCSRLWGGNQKTVALHLFSAYFKLGVCIALMVILLFAWGGKKALQEHLEDVVDEVAAADTDIINGDIFGLFLVQCLFRSVCIMYDGACITFRQDKWSGIAAVVSLVIYLPFVLIGHDSFEAIFAGEVVYFVVRASMLHWFLHKLGWKIWRISRGLDTRCSLADLGGRCSERQLQPIQDHMDLDCICFELFESDFWKPVAS